jgi:hypothetical protein
MPVPRPLLAVKGEEYTADEKKNRENITSFIRAEARYPSRR